MVTAALVQIDYYSLIVWAKPDDIYFGVICFCISMDQIVIAKGSLAFAQIYAFCTIFCLEGTPERTRLVAS